MVIVTRYNPNKSVREVKTYPSTVKGKMVMIVDSTQAKADYDNGFIKFNTGLWSW